MPYYLGPGVCKFVGYNAARGAVGCLGLGMGLGVLGPILLIGIGVAGGYYLLGKTRKIKMSSLEKE